MARPRAEFSDGPPWALAPAADGEWETRFGFQPAGRMTWQSESGAIKITANLGRRADGVMVVADLHVEATDSPAGVTSRMLQTIPLSSLLDDARPNDDQVRYAHSWEEYVNMGRRRETSVSDGGLARLIATGITEREPTPITRPGRPRRPDSFMAQLAAAYLRQPGPDIYGPLGEAFGLSRSALTKAIADARRRGWLTPARKQGTQGGDKGPLLLEYERVHGLGSAGPIRPIGR